MDRPCYLILLVEPLDEIGTRIFKCITPIPTDKYMSVPMSLFVHARKAETREIFWRKKVVREIFLTCIRPNTTMTAITMMIIHIWKSMRHIYKNIK